MVIRRVHLNSGYPEEHIFCAVNPGRGQMHKISCWTEAYGPPKKLGFLWCLLMPWFFFLPEGSQRSCLLSPSRPAVEQDSCPLSPVPPTGSRLSAWPFCPGEGGWARHDLTSNWVRCKLKEKYSQCPRSVRELNETPTANCKIWRPDLKGATF